MLLETGAAPMDGSMSTTTRTTTTTTPGVPSIVSLETQRHPLETSDLTVNDYVCFPDNLQELKDRESVFWCTFLFVLSDTAAAFRDIHSRLQQSQRTGGPCGAKQVKIRWYA
jgi:hypothetical protein